MDYYAHSQVIDYMDNINLSDTLLSELNELEQLGLYLLGQISKRKLLSLYGLNTNIDKQAQIDKLINDIYTKLKDIQKGIY
jgi:hypothetical protein